MQKAPKAFGEPRVPHSEFQNSQHEKLPRHPVQRSAGILPAPENAAGAAARLADSGIARLERVRGKAADLQNRTDALSLIVSIQNESRFAPARSALECR